MILLEGVTKKGNKWRFCLGKGCKDLDPLESTDPNDNDGPTIFINGRLYSHNVAILVDANMKYGLISKVPSELAFESCKGSDEIYKLTDVFIEYEKNKERLSVSSLLSILQKTQRAELECECE